MKDIRNLIAVARGKLAANLAVRNVRVFNVFTGEFRPGDVLCANGHVAAIVEAGSEDARKAANCVDGANGYLTPGFIDAHVHIESSHLCPEHFTSVAAAAGVTGIIADPHEICNVMGLPGLEYMLEATQNTPATVYFMLPSCVPASALGEAAQTLSAEDLGPFLKHERVLGLGEMMNYPGLLHRDEGVMRKLEAVHRYNEGRFGRQAGRLVDGHAPYVAGRDLQAYAAAGVSSDHEASTVEEAAERLALGMGLMMREGSSVKNLLDLVPAVTPSTVWNCMLCSDDRHVVDLMREGSVNWMVRKLVKDKRLPLADILRMASWNAARHFNLRDLGAVAPGYLASFALYPDLESWRPRMVWNRGHLVGKDGACCAEAATNRAPALRGRVRIPQGTGPESLRVADKGCAIRLIGIVPDQIITKNETIHLEGRNGFLEASPDKDIAKLAVFERHHETGRIGLGFVRGMGLRHGALASTVAHDAHNLIVMGMNDADMLLAINTLKDAGGGQIACRDGKVLALLPLPLAGIFSDAPADVVLEEQNSLFAAAVSLGLAKGVDPFMNLAFLSLEVIPSLKLTDAGLVDVEAFAHVPLYLEE